jgi:hypothetical protein
MHPYVAAHQYEFGWHDTCTIIEIFIYNYIYIYVCVCARSFLSQHVTFYINLGSLNLNIYHEDEWMTTNQNNYIHVLLPPRQILSRLSIPRFKMQIVLVFFKKIYRCCYASKLRLVPQSFSNYPYPSH